MRWLVAAVAVVTGCGPEESLEEREAPSLATQRAGLTQVTSFGTNPGNLNMYKYVPAGVPANAPLVVALHGCSQTATAYEGAGWNKLADLKGFYVLYPEQKSANNSSGCFNWFEVGDIARGQGEALSIKQMVDKMKADHSIDSSRVFITGLSAGAAMTGVMAAAYPDVFSGAAIMAGIPYKCATSMTGGFSCMSPGTDKTPAQWGDLVRGAYSGYAGPWPKISIWHGTSDFTVKTMNATEQMEQWTNVHGIDQTADVSETVAGFPHKVYKDGAGVARVETYELTGMGHGTAVDPQFSFPGSAVGCGTAGSYILDVNICSTWYAASFFGLASGGGGGGDTTAPTVNVTAPASGATVSSTVTITASASDAVGVSRVEFFVDGALVGTDTASPYSFAWNSASVANGSHALMAKAYDAAGNVGTDNDTSVTVSNTGGSTTTTVTFNSISAEDGYVKANADGSSPALGTLTSLAVGRGTDGKQNRTLLSFDTSSLPDTAVVVRAYVKVTWSSGMGDPWSNPAGNTLLVDVKNGTFGAAGTETTDFTAAPTASGVASIAQFSTGSKTSSDFSSAGLSSINSTGRTQLKLRFSVDPSTTQYAFFTEGAGAVLTVEYQ
ncbi:Flagellar hook-length control protein FliK [Hyalangium minutum]|uniref:Flagellar hook-length control protein FliK n=2 Tax=Hyalangium minutum TaxID=394096 RepID=A0A085WIM7_9BACT|nr:Flagellar hook-length control protein FliK [Hyalangium minutum]